jgi:integrase
MRDVGKLTSVSVRALVAKGKPARHADGGNLYLFLTGPGAAKWTFRYMRDGKAREMGLGSLNDMGLADARVAAEDARKRLRNGLDPIAHRRNEKAAQRATVGVNTFREVADLYIRSHKAGWKNPKHAAQWPSTLDTYVHRVLGKMPVSGVDTGAVMRVLEPIWTGKPETATRVRGRIEAILDYAKARGWREGENPARWRGHLANLLPARGKIARVEHHAALPWEDMGAFMAELRSRQGTAALALEFLILTAARSGEVRGATWAEVDVAARMWTVPAPRMKAGREHRVALSDAAITVLTRMRPLRKNDSDQIFPSPMKRNAPLSDMTLTAVLRRMKRDALTVHGFRSTFRDWCAETTGYPGEVAEMALSHTVADKVEAAYRRGDLMEKRRRLMEDWAAHCGGPALPTGVVPLRRA